jgi:hypothetical protein
MVLRCHPFQRLVREDDEGNGRAEPGGDGNEIP